MPTVAKSVRIASNFTTIRYLLTMLFRCINSLHMGNGQSMIREQKVRIFVEMGANGISEGINKFILGFKVSEFQNIWSPFHSIQFVERMLYG